MHSYLGVTEAVKRAPARRLAHEMGRAADVLQRCAGEPKLLRQIYTLGALETAGSLSLKACLLTAWGY